MNVQLLSIIGQRMRLRTPAPYEEAADSSAGSSVGVGGAPGLLSPARYEGWGRAISRSLTRSGLAGAALRQPPRPPPPPPTEESSPEHVTSALAPVAAADADAN